MNAYYIMKPNDNAVDRCAEELVVNIPIKGSNIVKPSGESDAQLNKKCSLCCHSTKGKKCKYFSVNTFKSHYKDCITVIMEQRGCRQPRYL